jgi:hypothetical protein
MNKPTKENPICHFTLMDYEGGEYDESWFICKHCGHTVEVNPPNSYER